MNNPENTPNVQYDASQIKVLEGLEAVRKRPGMYIGSTGSRGLHHLVFELVDNSVDEALAGFCNTIYVSIEEDGSVIVEDNGRGIPTEIHPQYNVPGLEIAATKLHAGGKFDKTVYKVSGGLHGVGLSVVNALSKEMEIYVKRNGKIHYQKFERGNKVTELQIIGETNETGTKIRFYPDSEIFETVIFDGTIIATRLEEIAYLTPKLKIIFEDKRNNIKQEFYSEGGIIDLLNEETKNIKKLHEPIYFSGSKNDVSVEIAMVYTEKNRYNFISFVNNINTVEGGTHVTGFKSGVVKVMKKFVENEKIDIDSEDILEGIYAVISIKHYNPEFEGQTKAKLGNTDARFAVESIVSENFNEYLLMHNDVVKILVDKITTAAKARLAAKQAAELVRRKNSLNSFSLPGKLADCVSKKVEESELFIVEGDSAGGNAKQARNKEFQAILPLKGKILNIEKANLAKIMDNEEIKAIITAIGTGIDKNFDINRLRYGKIIIMSDADVDGSHISTLLLTLFYRLMPQLIEKGHIFRAMPPLYKIKAGKEIFYAFSDKEKEEIVKTLESQNKSYDVSRYKGLGEMNAEELWETTMNPEKRKLKQIFIEDAIEAERMFEILMGENVEKRREFIMQHALEVKNLDI
ncbi:MAG: DNA topoisomerase (ATP-hydrolyzing) subunit B [Candidatus Woesearchaeota archaeon]